MNRTEKVDAMARFTVNCPACGVAHQFLNKHIGRRYRCECGEQFRVPDPASLAYRAFEADRSPTVPPDVLDFDIDLKEPPVPTVELADAAPPLLPDSPMPVRSAKKRRASMWPVHVLIVLAATGALTWLAIMFAQPGGGNRLIGNMADEVLGRSDVAVTAELGSVDGIAVMKNGNWPHYDPHLLITAELTNRSKATLITYRGQDRGATLKDEHGNQYDRFEPPYGWFRVLHSGAKRNPLSLEDIHPGKTVTDYLLFKPPIDAARKLTLTIPGECFKPRQSDVVVVLDR